MTIPFSYLERQFADIDPYLDDIRTLVAASDFTLGSAVAEFESTFATYIGLPHAVGVGSGTDALILSLKMLSIGPGDEVITAANTFIATAGAIIATGARPVFVDSEDGFVIDIENIEAAITENTRAIIPVHYTGNVADMPALMEIAERHRLEVIEDCAQAIGAQLNDMPVGSWGRSGAFSVHPLKNINVWGDGGLILTRDEDFAEQLRLYRNHGLTDRDHVQIFGINCRLDSIQAIVGNRLIKHAANITERRISIANRFDEAFVDIDEIRIPKRRPGVRHVFHLYILRVEHRDALLTHLTTQGVEAKVHYPIPIHLQEAAKDLGYKRGDFPVAEADAGEVITLPAHQHIEDWEAAKIITEVRSFYGR
jgi:dTDP-3-amino-2,3,6-trideoxy-4-keto-D-glucose/dTDP-3-amino-3,4,6-trideoxy-alpha-D-glucose/dTDP-2,6-dideoxy-D-kanosamine transaminase